MNKEQLLLKEIEIIQSEIARFDSNGLTIKEWCVGVWAGLIAFGFSEKQPVIFFAAIATTLSFAFVEFTYRRFQGRFIDRSEVLENLLESENLQSYTYRIHRIAVKNSGFILESIRVAKMGQFTVFYLMLVALAALAACYSRHLTVV